MESARSLRFALVPSAQFAVLITGLHAIAALCILTVSTAWPAVAAAFFVMALGIAAAWDRALLRGRGAPKVLELDLAGRLACVLTDGRSVAVDAPARAAVNRYWVALRLQSRRRRSMLVLAGMLAPSDFRRLRLWALWGRVPGVALRQLPGGP